MIEEALMDEQVANAKADHEKARQLMDADPTLPFITAVIMAGDLRSAERSLGYLRTGTYPYKLALALVGSYGRWEFMLRARDEGLATTEQLLEDLPDYWSGSDPDDTDPRFLALWREAVAANGGKYLRDAGGRALPRSRMLTVYRGQDEGVPFGIAWSLDRDIAMKFAAGAAYRQWGRGGVVYAARIPRDKVLGFMTKRNEAEVVLDPADLNDAEVDF